MRDMARGETPMSHHSIRAARSKGSRAGNTVASVGIRVCAARSLGTGLLRLHRDLKKDGHDDVPCMNFSDDPGLFEMLWDGQKRLFKWAVSICIHSDANKKGGSRT